MRKLLSVGAAALCVAGMAHAQTKSNTSVQKVEKKKAKTDEVDQKITNRRFRASNGSLSDWSFNSNLSYSGGSIKNPFSADRPNITGAGNTALVSGLSGTLNMNRRLGKLDRIGLGVGVQMLAPFHSSIDTQDKRAQGEFERNQGKLDINNPTLSYIHMDNFKGVQTILSAGLTQYTAGNLRDFGYAQSLSVTVNTMYEFGKSGFSVGLLGTAEKNRFDNDDPSLQGAQNDTIFGFLPQAEYVINDTFNLRTIIRSHWYQNTRQDTSKYKRRDMTQSVGLGISLSRDVFIYPNVQFAYENFSVDNTNFGLSTNINLF